MSSIAMDAVLTTRDMTESQRSFELSKFFAPRYDDKTYVESVFNDNLNNDGALDAYAETILWRLRGVHAMVSLIDRGHQYFLAGAVRKALPDEEEEDVVNNNSWFGCSSVPTPGGLCENTVALDASKDDYSCFIVNDLIKDERFQNLPIVDGSTASYRFYAGTPITTNHGVNIGSLFLFDSKPREDLTMGQRKFLHQQAANVMRHLETKREAAERRRAALMSKGIADFLERTSQYRDLNTSNQSEPDDSAQIEGVLQEEQSLDGVQNTSTSCHKLQETPAKESALDRIRISLDNAADILQESLELTVGGVVFLDAVVGHSEIDDIDSQMDIRIDFESEDSLMADRDKKRQQTMDGSLRPPLTHGGGTSRHLSQGLIRSSTYNHKPPKVLAASASSAEIWDPQAEILNTRTLGSLIKSYPKGNVWSINEEGHYSSLDQISEWEKVGVTNPSKKRRSIPPMEMTRQKSEAAMLSQIFQNARQIMFFPLWDAGANRWYAGCFVWSQSAVPVFTMESELAYLSVFTNSMMVEISRLDAVTANKMKSDFIGSISHEFRSPLHGILASAEFLRDSLLDSSQAELVSTIQNCSGTLLDTINHVLDYSKINSFETSGSQQGLISNELYQVTNLALLCEDVVEGMVAANGFRGSSLGELSIPNVTEVQPRGRRHMQHQHHSQLEIVVDIEQRDWDYRVEAGALRRIVMNLFGNAQKFTHSGYIIVELRILDLHEDDEMKPPATTLSLKIRDSGKGMSSEYMERKLYHPFAQEDAFAPGVGLGLSIVWSIVNRLGGNIQIRSELGKGTDVEVTLTVQKSKYSAHPQTKPGDLMKISADAEQIVNKLRSRAGGKSVCFSRSKTILPTACHRGIFWSCIERYCSDWFGFEIKPASADIIVTDQGNQMQYADGQRVLIIHEDINCSSAQSGKGIASVCNPVGPFKLARFILALMDQETSTESSVSRTPGSRSDIGTQTPLGSPEERTILNGIIMTDYGFTNPPTFSNTPELATMEQTSESKQKYGDDQAFSAVKALSGMTFRLPRKRKTIQNQIATQCPRDDLSRPRRVSPPSIPLPVSPPKSPILATTTKYKPLRILAVDDNDLNLQLLQRYLLKRKLDTIVTAKNGVEAIDAVRGAALESRFDVIFMDISMPEMDGFEATRLVRSYERSLAHRSFEDGAALSPRTQPTELRLETTSYVDVGTEKMEEDRCLRYVGKRRGSRAHIVALTGLASRRDRDEAEQSGFDDYLTKPISFARIGELLDRLSGEEIATV